MKAPARCVWAFLPLHIAPVYGDRVAALHVMVQEVIGEIVFDHFGDSAAHFARAEFHAVAALDEALENIVIDRHRNAAA